MRLQWTETNSTTKRYLMYKAPTHENKTTHLSFNENSVPFWKHGWLFNLAVVLVHYRRVPIAIYKNRGTFNSIASSVSVVNSPNVG